MWVKLTPAILLWSPSEVVCIEVLRDEIFFQNCVPIADAFISNVLLPEIIAQLFTRETMPLSDVDDSNASNACKVYCICKKPYDGSQMMIYCENENCQNGRWFHQEFIIFIWGPYKYYVLLVSLDLYLVMCDNDF